MNKRRWRRLPGVAAVAVVLIASPSPSVAQSAVTADPVRHTLVFRGAEREYFVYLPPGYNRDTRYWPLVVMGGGFLPTRIVQRVAESRFEAIVISPSTPSDINATRFPPLGEGEFLQDLLKAVRKEYPLRPKILLAGYSRGAQFAHRFALAFPELVEAVAPLASGTWTTPDGRFLVEAIGEVPNPRAFLSNAENAASVPARLNDLFESRVAAVAGTKAAAGAQKVPFLVMCGTVDPRLPIAKEFVRSLEALAYRVAVEWPRTPHTCADDACRAEYQAEFQKYPRTAVEFFQRIVGERLR